MTQTSPPRAGAVARLLLTLDRGLGDICRYPRRYAGIVVLRRADQSAAAVRAVVTELAADSKLEALAGLVAVAQPGLLRIRRVWPPSHKRTSPRQSALSGPQDGGRAGALWSVFCRSRRWHYLATRGSWTVSAQMTPTSRAMTRTAQTG